MLGFCRKEKRREQEKKGGGGGGGDKILQQTLIGKAPPPYCLCTQSKRPLKKVNTMEKVCSDQMSSTSGSKLNTAQFLHKKFILLKIQSQVLRFNCSKQRAKTPFREAMSVHPAENAQRAKYVLSDDAIEQKFIELTCMYVRFWAAVYVGVNHGDMERVCKK